MPIPVVAGACAATEPKSGVAVNFGAAPAPKLNILVPDPLNVEVDVSNSDAETGVPTGATVPNLSPPNGGLVACVVFVVVEGAAGNPLEPNLNGSDVDGAVTRKPCDVVGFAICVLEPNWKDAGVSEAALAIIAFVSLALNMGVDGSAGVAPAAVPKHGCAGAIEAVLEIGLLPPSDGPVKTKPPTAGFTLSGAGAVAAAEAVGFGSDSADACVDERDAAAELVGVGKSCDAAGEAVVVASVAFGDVNFAKAANSGFAVEEAAAAGTDAGTTCVTAFEAVVLAVLVVEFELKKPAPNWGFGATIAVLAVGAVDATDVLMVVAGAELRAGRFFSSSGWGGEATVDDALITGLLITDTVLVVDPSTRVALVVAPTGMPNVGRPGVFSRAEGFSVSA